jgi:hypothetical protein
VGPDDITAARLSEILGGEIGAIESTRIGDGLVGLNLRVRLLDAAPELPDSVVIKLPSTDETSRATGIVLRNYEREVKFYLQVAHTVDIRVPQCHFGEWDESTGDFTLVLEDMAPAEQGDQVTGCSVERAEDAVEELALLHAPRWDDPTLHDIDWLGRRTSTEAVTGVAALWSMFHGPFLQTYAKYLSTEQVDLSHAFGPRILDWMGDREGPLAITHGDYRLDNLLFATPAGGPAVTAVDWQTPGHGPPVADLAYFLGAGLLSDERAIAERSLLDRYATALAKRSVDVDSSWLWTQYCRESFGGVVMAVVASQVVGESVRSESMFAAMATRHLQHALDTGALDLI